LAAFLLIIEIRIEGLLHDPIASHVENTKLVFIRKPLYYFLQTNLKASFCWFFENKTRCPLGTWFCPLMRRLRYYNTLN